MSCAMMAPRVAHSENREWDLPGALLSQPGVSMKAYVTTTGAVFGLLTAAHVWRVLAEGPHLAKDPFYVAITVATAAFCLWACRLIGTGGARDSAGGGSSRSR